MCSYGLEGKVLFLSWHVVVDCSHMSFYDDLTTICFSPSFFFLVCLFISATVVSVKSVSVCVLGNVSFF